MSTTKSSKQKPEKTWVCDGCGETVTGKKNKIYNENWALERGVYECDNCKYGHLDEEIMKEEQAQAALFPDDKSSGAIFSADKKHRLKLWRTWDNDLPKLMFIGLNPSTANETDNDPTIKSCIRISKHNGYGGIIMMNCWTYISTDPSKLQIEEPDFKSEEWLMGNDDAIAMNASYADVCFAWGNFKIVADTGRGEQLARMLPYALCLGKNKNGSPKHPLYCKTDTKLIPY